MHRLITDRLATVHCFVNDSVVGLLVTQRSNSHFDVSLKY